MPSREDMIWLAAIILAAIGLITLIVKSRKKSEDGTQRERDLLQNLEKQAGFRPPPPPPAAPPAEEAVEQPEESRLPEPVAEEADDSNGPPTPITSIPGMDPSKPSNVRRAKQPSVVNVEDPSTTERRRRSKAALKRMETACESPDEERLHSKLSDSRAIKLDMEETLSNIGPIVTECLRDYLALQGETELLQAFFALRPDLKTPAFCKEMIDLYDWLLRDLQRIKQDGTKKHWQAAKDLLSS